MPFYCYTSEDGSCSDKRFYRVGKQPKHVTVNGIRLFRDIAAEHNGFHDTPGNYPRWSDAAGVAPSQVKEATRYAQEVGVPTEYNEDGQVKFENRTHERRFMKAHGLCHWNAGYGDAAPTF